MFTDNSIVHTLCLGNLKSKLDAWYCLHNPTEETDIWWHLKFYQNEQ